MKFKDLTDVDIEYLEHIYYENMKHVQKMEILSKKFKVTKRTIRRWWKEELKLTERLSTLPKQLQDAQKREIKKGTNIILYTSAQNKTGINSRFLENLVAFKIFLIDLGYKVEIIISPQRYRNPTSPSESDRKKAQLWWVDEVVPYLFYGKYQFGDTLISTDSRIRPTAKDPLIGYEVLAKDNNLVLPHSKIHFKTLPRFKGHPLRTMSTTGYITNKNYSDSKAGETAWEHHSYGFVIIEKKKDGTCHIPRNVKVKSDGSFIDINKEVKNGEVSIIDKCDAVVMGDIHASEVNDAVLDKSFELFSLIKPDKIVLHDVFDGSTVNPHEVKDMYIQRQKIKQNKYLVEDEIKHSFDVVDLISKYTNEVHISISNHDVFLDRHINDGNWKRDLHNSPTYLKYAYIQQTEDLSDCGNIYGYLLNERFKNRPVFYMSYGDSLKIQGYECALHGEHGTNGSRGSYKQFSRLNTKMIHAHTHSPILFNSVTVVGVSCNIDQYYTRRGLSSWAYAHSIVHPNGKNQLLVLGDDLKISGLI
ncbi:MAG: hypothetical protein ACJAVA_000177 [Flavobacteriaceae bacterium]|jgi:hypothetical protein